MAESRPSAEWNVAEKLDRQLWADLATMCYYPLLPIPFHPILPCPILFYPSSSLTLIDTWLMSVGGLDLKFGSN